MTESSADAEITCTQSKMVLDFLRVSRRTMLAYFHQPDMEEGQGAHFSMPIQKWDDMGRRRQVTVTVVPGNEFETTPAEGQEEIPDLLDPEYAEWARVRGIAGAQLRR